MFMNTKHIYAETILKPTALKNGNGIPIIGSTQRTMPILIAAWKNIIAKTQTHIKSHKLSFALFAIWSMQRRYIISIYIIKVFKQYIMWHYILNF